MKTRAVAATLTLAVLLAGCAAVPPGAYYPLPSDPATARVAHVLHRAAVAAALAEEEVGVDTFSPGRIKDERLLALARKVRYAIDPASSFPRAFPGRLRIRLVDGRVLEAAEPFNRGSAENPLRAEEVVAKFRRNAGRVLPPSRVSALESAALGLERSASLRSLLALCALA